VASAGLDYGPDNLESRLLYEISTTSTPASDTAEACLTYTARGVGQAKNAALNLEVPWYGRAC
jgi:hypothetical protein